MTRSDGKRLAAWSVLGSVVVIGAVLFLARPTVQTVIGGVRDPGVADEARDGLRASLDKCVPGTEQYTFTSGSYFLTCLGAGPPDAQVQWVQIEGGRSVTVERSGPEPSADIVMTVTELDVPVTSILDLTDPIQEMIDQALEVGADNTMTDYTGSWVGGGALLIIHNEGPATGDGQPCQVFVGGGVPPRPPDQPITVGGPEMISTPAVYFRSTPTYSWEPVDELEDGNYVGILRVEGGKVVPCP